MINRIYIQKIALTIGAIFLLNCIAFAQNNVLELLPGADKFEYNEKTGIHSLTGNINFIYQGNTMYCDSAHYKDKSQEVRAYGNVHITKHDLNLFCDSLYYNGKTKKAKLWGNVRVRDQEYKITTDTLEYDANKAVGIYRYGGRVESILEKVVLTSRIGYMYSESKNLFFSGKVVYKSPDLRMTTDTLRYQYNKSTAYFYGPTNITTKLTEPEESSKIYCESGWYNTETEEATLQKNARIVNKAQVMKGDYLYSYVKKGLSIGKGNVFFKDTTENIEFRGEYAYSSEAEKRSFLTGKALVLKIDGKDTLYIHADSLFTYKDTLGKTSHMYGYNHVKIFRNELQAVCDSIVYDKEKSKMELYSNPIVWAKIKTEMKGDFIEILFAGDTIIDRVNITGNSTVLMEIDSGKYYNQIGGKNINALLRNNEIYRTDVKGNARTVFFPENTETKDTLVTIKRLGMNRIYSSDLKVHVDSNEVTGITYLDKPDGVFYPMDQIKSDEQFIQGFKWQAILRPKNWMDLISE